MRLLNLCNLLLGLLRAGNTDHSTSLKTCAHIIQTCELLLRDAEATRERIDGLARLHDVVVVAIVIGDAIERGGILGNLGLRLLLVGFTHRRTTNPQCLTHGQRLRIERGVILAQRSHRDVVVARYGVECLPCLHLVREKIPLATLLCLGALLSRLGHGNLHRLVDLKLAAHIGIMLTNQLLAHLVGLGQGVERVARLDGVDVELLSVDKNYNCRFLHGLHINGHCEHSERQRKE